MRAYSFLRMLNIGLACFLFISVTGSVTTKAKALPNKNNISSLSASAIEKRTLEFQEDIKNSVIIYLTEDLYLQGTTYNITVNSIQISGSSAKAEVFLVTESELGAFEDIIVVYIILKENEIAHIFKEPSEEYYLYIDEVSPDLVNYETIEYWKSLRQEELQSAELQALSTTSVLYYLPWFNGKKYIIYQDYNKHFDFLTPIGANEVGIRASRGGVVHNAVGSKNETYVRILHSDGTYAFYVHLKASSYKVGEGKNVRAGDCIGVSGATGSNITGPHTHFNVSKSSSNSDYGSPFGSGWVAVQFIEGTLTYGQDTPVSQNPSNSCVPPGVSVTGASASDGTYSSYVRLDYNNVSNATRYEIWRGTTNSISNASKIFDDNGSAHNDSTATYNVIYYYWVRACNVYGCSGYSNSDSGYRTNSLVPDTVTGVTVSDGTIASYIRVGYNNVSNATRYEIWRSTTSSLSNASKIFDDNGTAHHDSTAAYDVVYYYWVRACNTSGCAGYSNSDSGYRTLTPVNPCPNGNDDISCATNITALPYSNSISTTNATEANEDPPLTACDLPVGKKSVWYKLIPNINDTVFIDTINSDYDTVLSIFSGAPDNLTEITCNDDYDSSQQSRIQVDLLAATTYYMLISEYDGVNISNGGSLQFQVRNLPFATNITRLSSTPTKNNTVDFQVVFSESVTNVDINDFLLSTTGISGASISSVNGAGTIYTVVVNTGSGSGTLRVDLTDNDTIIDVAANKLGGSGLGNGNFTSGETYVIDKTDPTVSSITRLNPSPTNASSVNFNIVFSEFVTNVDIADFTLTTTGVTDAYIMGIKGSNNTYTLIVNIGRGDGTIRLDLIDNDTIIDSASNLLGGTGSYNGNFANGEVYIADKTLVFKSNHNYDGWTLESKETSNIGNTKMNTGNLRVGDDKLNRQYRSLLYFDTAGLPNNAVITKAVVRIEQNDTLEITTLGNLIADMKKGFYGLAPLETGDFSALGAPINTAGRFVKNTSTHTLTLSPAHFKYINLSGVTQFRLRFTKDDDNNKIADYLNFFSGEDSANPPRFLIEYYIP